MSQRAARFRQLCRLLRENQDPAGLRRFVVSLDKNDWVAIMAAAKRELVVPAIWRSLSAYGVVDSLPASVAETLGRLYQLNEVRNRAIKAQLIDGIRTLNTVGIRPLVLKTAVNLTESPRSEIGTWVMRDFDLLITPDQFDTALAALQDYGYRSNRPGLPESHIHAWPLVRQGGIASLDLHKDIGPQRHILSVAEAVQYAQPLSLDDGIEASALSPTHRIIHLVFHDAVQDRRHELGTVSLRQMVNFATAIRHHGKDIDWICAEAAFNRAGLASILEAYCYKAERLLGISEVGMPRADWRARLHYHRCQSQLTVPFVISAMKLWSIFIHRNMTRTRLHYIYGDAGTPVQRMMRRARQGWSLVQENRLQLFTKIRAAYRFRDRM